MRRPSIGRTSRRTTSPATRPKSGCRCAPTSSTPTDDIELRLETRVDGIDVRAQEVVLADGEPGRLRRAAARDRRRAGAAADLPGADLPHVHTLRTLADSRAIIAQAPRRAAPSSSARASSASRWPRRCAPAASRSTSSRPRRRPLEQLLGPELGDFVRALHEEHGVSFHLDDTPTAIDRRARHADERRHARRRSRRRRRRRPPAPRRSRSRRASRSTAA